MPRSRPPRPSSSARLVLRVSIALVLACGAGGPPWLLAAKKPTGPYRVVPGPWTKGSTATGRDPAAHATVQGVQLTAEFLEPPARAAFIRTLDAGRDDPFAPAPGKPDYFHAFRVTIDNRSDRDVTFQPQNVILWLGPADQRYPLDLTDFYRMAARDAARDPQAWVDRVTPIIYDVSVTIPAGSRIDRLLVFRPFPEKWKELRLGISFMQIGTETHSLSFLFHREPAGEGGHP